MFDFYDNPTVFCRAEPDDEYDPKPDPLDPYLIDQDEVDETEIDDEEELDEDEI